MLWDWRSASRCLPSRWSSELSNPHNPLMTCIKFRQAAGTLPQEHPSIVKQVALVLLFYQHTMTHCYRNRPREQHYLQHHFGHQKYKCVIAEDEPSRLQPDVNPANPGWGLQLRSWLQKYALCSMPEPQNIQEHFSWNKTEMLCLKASIQILRLWTHVDLAVNYAFLAVVTSALTQNSIYWNITDMHIKLLVTS